MSGKPKCQHQLSIHGRCNKCGVRSERPYNGNPQEPKLPTTARGKRRMVGKYGSSK